MTNDVGRLVPNQLLYSVMCNEHGGIVDDVIVMRGRRRRPLHHRRQRVDAREGRRLDARAAPAATSSCHDLSDELALIAVQGPRAVDILEPLARMDEDGPSLRELRPFFATGLSLAGHHRRDGPAHLAHRLHRRGRLRDLHRLRARRAGLGRDPRGRRRTRAGAGGPRRARHAAARGGPAPVRPGHGRRHRPVQLRARLDGEARQGRLHRPRRAAASCAKSPPHRFVGPAARPAQHRAPWSPGVPGRRARSAR